MKAVIFSEDKKVFAEQGPKESDTDFYNRVHDIKQFYNLRVLGHFEIEFKEDECVTEYT